MSPDEAKEFGIIDEVVANRPPLPKDNVPIGKD
jgi:ATP-dependent protease ClpP protease subunit